MILKIGSWLRTLQMMAKKRNCNKKISLIYLFKHMYTFNIPTIESKWIDIKVSIEYRFIDISYKNQEMEKSLIPEVL